jgi:UDP-glucose:glycoprotein glucosyltransferase
MVYAALAETVQHVDGGPLASYEEIQQGIGKRTSSISSRLNKTRDYLRRLGVKLIASDQAPKTSLGFFLMNGAFFPIDEQFTQNLQQSLGLHTQFLAQEAYTGGLTDDLDVKTYFADLPSTHRRRNSWIYPSEEKPLSFVNMVEAYNGIQPGFVQNFYSEGSASPSLLAVVAGASC